MVNIALTLQELVQLDLLLYKDDPCFEKDEELTQLLQRARRTAGERASRLRRQENLKQMQEQVRVLEHVLGNYAAITAPFASSTALTASDSNVDADTERIRHFLARAAIVDREKSELEQQGAQLKRLLREHEVTQKLFKSWFAPPKKSAWEVDIEYWNSLSETYFDDWPVDDCVSVLKYSLKMIHELSQSKDFVSSGREFMGWTDRRRVDLDTSTLQFSFAKGFRNCDTQRLFELYWDMHFSAEKLCRNMLGWSNKVHVELLQQVNDDIAIFRRDVQYPGIELRFHTIYIMFRVKTKSGFLHCIRTIPAPGLQHAMEGDGGWMNNFHWTHMDFILDDVGEPTGCRVSFSGLISSKSIEFANRWMIELAMTLVRAESAFVSPLFLGAGNFSD